MNELKGKFVNIVLSIEEGRGFDSIKNSVYVTANFNGRVMESDLIEPHPVITFNTEMVWESEKKLLRKARGSYGRIRLECFTVDKKFIGFALLCLRSAKVLPSSRTNLVVPFAWNKLLNVPTEFKKGIPELYVSLTIRDYIATKIIPPALPNFEGSNIAEDDLIQIPVKYTDHGYIQVGNDREHLEKFHLKITVSTATNLDVLLPEKLVFGELAKKYYLQFAIFGMTVKTKHVTRDIHENLSINETIVINLLTNFKILGLYFQKFSKIPIYFYNNESKLGTAEINITNMGWDVDNAVFHNWCDGKLEFEEESYFINEATTMITNRKPSLTTRSIIQLVNDFDDKKSICGILSPKMRYSSCQDNESLVDRKLSRSFQQNLARIEEKSDPSLVTLQQSSSSLSPANPLDKYRQFCIDIILDFIIWKKMQKNVSYAINFVHPKANTFLNIRTEIDSAISKRVFVDNAICKLIFVCVEGNINGLLKLHKVKVEIFDGKRQKLAGDFFLDCGNVNPNKPEFSQLIPLKNAAGDEIAEIHACLFLEMCDFKSIVKTSSYYLLPHILDDNVILSGIEELENWKESERGRFIVELGRTKKQALDALRHDWISRRENLESDLRNNIERCKRLSYHLKKHAYGAKLDRLIFDRNGQDDEFNMYLEIHKNTVKYSLCESHELIEKISTLERDCVILRDLLAEQSLEMQEIKKFALTEEQTKNLLNDLKKLEEKYEEAQRDKHYFKSEWEKAAKEVHQLKIEDQMNLQSKLQTDKEELSQLNLDTYLGMGDGCDKLT